jgi:UDP-glucose 4-epimerase
VATSEGDADAEVEAFRGFLGAVDDHLDPEVGRLLLVSSAGALYAGSHGPPFDEETDIAPISPYGMSKKAQEDLLVEFVTRTGATGITARVANVYGERQDLTKQQGLISLLCHAILSRRPVRIFVPLDTRRHLVWADDAGRAIVNLLDSVPLESGHLATRVVVAGRALTVGEMIARVRRVVGVTPPHLVTQTTEARLHPVDLRLRTRHVNELGLLAPTPLEVGIARTWRAALGGGSRR